MSNETNVLINATIAVHGMTTTCLEHNGARRRDLGDGWNRCSATGCKHTRRNASKKED